MGGGEGSDRTGLTDREEWLLPDQAGFTDWKVGCCQTGQVWQKGSLAMDRPDGFDKQEGWLLPEQTGLRYGEVGNCQTRLV